MRLELLNKTNMVGDSISLLYSVLFVSMEGFELILQALTWYLAGINIL